MNAVSDYSICLARDFIWIGDHEWVLQPAYYGDADMSAAIVYNQVLDSESGHVGIDLGATAPKSAQLHAYRAAQWGAFAFGVLGKRFRGCKSCAL